MDYEKKYKEANDKVAARFGTNVAKEIFTDLYESEDERIRKELIDIVAKSPITFAFEDKNKVLSWLEKQGVQKPQRMISAGAKEAMYNKPACVWSEEDEVYLNTTIAYLKDAKDFKKTAENCIDWLKKLKQRIGDKL